MNEQSDEKMAVRQERDQMLRLVSKGFYNELINYGVRKEEILRVASHLLDNLMAQEKKPEAGVQYYNRMFTLDTVQDEWKERRQLAVQHATLLPLQPAVIARVVEWLKNPAVRESFVPAFPEKERDLQKYFTHPTRDYFGIYYNGQPVGIVGGGDIEPPAGPIGLENRFG